MIEAAMIFALGFLVASAIGFVFLNAVWRRAVRLTTKRVESTMPLSMIEIKADKDQLRAEFAMATRKLEVNLDQLRERANEQFADIGFKTETIRTLKGEIAQKNASIATLEDQRNEQEERQREANRQIIERQSALDATTIALKAKEAELRAAQMTIADKEVDADRTRIDLVSLQTQIEHLRLQTKSLERDLAEANERLASSRAAMSETTEALTSERQHIVTLQGQVSGLVDNLAEKSNLAAALQDEITALKNEMTGQNARMVVEQKERDRLEAAIIEAHEHLQNSQTEIVGLKANLAEREQTLGAAIDTMRADKLLAEKALAKLREEHATVNAELAALKAQSGEEWSSDRVDQALMRERINDIAAEVARMTLLLEGKGSPIEAILAATPPRHDNTNLSTPVSLADRVRALRDQATIARVSN